jgi:tetratricopeptide (TPR) repeat protein
MKAQHRKELQTNVLADRIGRLIESVKAGPSQTTMMVITGIIVLGTAVFFGWRYYSNVSKQNRSELWLKVEEATDLQKLEKIANENPNTVAGKVARLQWARTLYRQGIEKLYSVSDRDTAKQNLEEARKLYDQVAKELSDNPVMTQEALMGSAKARESLGDVDGATTAYEKLAKDFPKSTLGKEAEERAKQLRDNGDQVKNFYTELNNLADSKK